MKIEAGQWWETRGGDRAQVRYVAPEEMSHPVFVVTRYGNAFCVETLTREGRYYATSAGEALADLVKHLPDCTGWDWEPPKPVDPGEGWRLLEVGEIRQKGDEFQSPTFGWTPICDTIGLPHSDGSRPVRRRIKPDVPADWKLIGGVPGGMLYFKPTEAT